MNPFTRAYPGRVMEKFVWRMTALVVMLLLAVGGLTLSLFAVVQSNRTSALVTAVCPFMQVIANSPVAPTTTVLGFKILAESRKTYIYLGCSENYGKLHHVDPKVKPYLPAGLADG